MPSTAPTTAPTTRQITSVAIASIVGSVIEQYDFLVTGIIAATVWGGIFFKLHALAAVAAAIGVYGIGIMIRPVGAYIFGNLADRAGRKNALVGALVLMGVSTLLIGLTPTYATIGIAAPILLIIFRLAQGISFGAEFGTASTWVIEQAAHSKYRGFWGAWVGFAIPIGLLAAAFMLGFMIIGAFLADRISRRAVLLTSAITFLVFAIPYFYLINTHQLILAAIAEIIGFGFVFGFGYGAIPAFYTENFPTRYRASGASAGYQISQVYGGGLIPILAGLILKSVGIKHAFIYIGLLVMAYAAAAIAAILMTPETGGSDLSK